MWITFAFAWVWIGTFALSRDWKGNGPAAIVATVVTAAMTAAVLLN